MWMRTGLQQLQLRVRVRMLRRQRSGIRRLQRKLDLDSSHYHHPVWLGRLLLILPAYIDRKKEPGVFPDSSFLQF